MTIASQTALKHAEPDDKFIEPAQSLIQTVEAMARNDFDLNLDTYLAAGTLFDQAFTKIKEGKWAEALAEMQESARLNPRSQQAFGNIGICLIQPGRVKEAREALEQALKINPDYEPSKENLRLLNSVDENNPSPPMPLRIINEGGFD